MSGLNINVTKDKVTINNFTTNKTNYLVEDLISFLTTIRNCISEDIDAVACIDIDTYLERRLKEGFDLDSDHVFVMNQAFRQLFNKKIAKNFNTKYVDALMSYASI